MSDRTPPERRVGYGTRYADGDLDVPCGTCKAPVGQPCTRRGGGSHAPRCDKARNRAHRESYRLFSKLENEALRRDPNGPLWSFDAGATHRCGALGPHVLADCVPADEVAE